MISYSLFKMFTFLSRRCSALNVESHYLSYGGARDHSVTLYINPLLPALNCSSVKHIYQQAFSNRAQGFGWRIFGGRKKLDRPTFTVVGARILLQTFLKMCSWDLNVGFLILARRDKRRIQFWRGEVAGGRLQRDDTWKTRFVNLWFQLEGVKILFFG